MGLKGSCNYGLRRLRSLGWFLQGKLQSSLAIWPPHCPSRQAQESSVGLTNHPREKAGSTLSRLCPLCTFFPRTESGQQSLNPASKALDEFPARLHRPLPFIPLIHLFIHSPLNPSIYFRDQGDLGNPHPGLDLHQEPISCSYISEKTGVCGILTTLLLTLQPHVSQS